MAEALLRGILVSQLATPQDISVGERLEMRRAFLEREYSLQAHSQNLDAIDGADITVLAVKPQDMDQVMSEINGSLGKDNAVISIAAGVKMATLVKGLNHPAVIRVMPNTPAQIGAGMCVWTASEEVKDTTIETTRKILQTTGEELYVSDEKLVDMATALSASGPAYVFQFIEALIDGGVYLGMPRDAARKLAIQTVLGSVLLAKDSGRHPAELKDMVTSPGGTTAEALLALEEGGFTASVIQAVRAAYEKSKALGA